jgi:ABC-2 type transport system ATP-binding protein
MLELSALQKVQDQRTVIQIDSFKLAAGEIAGLVGAAGSGQETLLALLTGQMQPSHGQVRLAGLDPLLEKEALSQRVGVLFAEDGLYKNLSALENLRFQCRLRGLPLACASQTLALIGLADQSRTSAGQLPGGLQRRLALGRAVLHQPAVLLLVEPFHNCDEASIQFISELLRELAGRGAAILVMASESARLSGLCDSLYELLNGRIEQASRIEQIARPTAGEAAQRPFKIPVKLEGKVELVNPAEILYAEAEGDSAAIQTVERRLSTQFTLAELEARLGRSGFFRAHRAFLVNLQHVKEVIPFTRNSFSLRLDDPSGTIIPLSKSAAGELKQLLDY